jgi:hypothetical protein
MNFHCWRSLTQACALALCASQTLLPLPESDVLNRPVTLNHLKGTSGAAISLLLSEAHVSGGMISTYDNCTQPNTQDYSLNETTLQHGLDYVSKIDGTRKWTQKNGLIIVGFEQADNTILSAVIHDADINPEDALTLTAQRLLMTNEVRSKIEMLGLNQLSPELGFDQIRKNPTPPPLQSPPRQQKHLHEVSLLDALNIVAAMKGTAVWEYEQYSCNKRSAFRLGWVVK